MIACVCVKFHSLGQKKKVFVFSLDCSLPGGQQWLDFSGSILYVYTHLDLGEQELEFDTCPCSVSRGFSNLSGEVPGPQVHQGNGLTFKLPFFSQVLEQSEKSPVLGGYNKVTFDEVLCSHSLCLALTDVFGKGNGGYFYTFWTDKEAVFQKPEETHLRLQYFLRRMVVFEPKEARLLSS